MSSRAFRVIACCIIWASVASCRCEFADLTDDPAMAELMLLPKSKPEEALRAALRRGDDRFIGVAGFSVEVPGVEHVYDTFVQRYGIRVIEGTGDTGIDDTRADLIIYAKKWAERYNTLLLSELSKRESRGKGPGSE